MGRAKQISALPAFDKGVRNAEGYLAFRRSWQEQYCQMLLTNTMTNTFYAAENELMTATQFLHEFAVNEDPFFMAKAMVYARNKGFMKLQPIYGLVVLSAVSPSLFERIFPMIIQTVGDLADFLVLLNATGRGQGGRAVKRACSRFLNQVDEYAVLKYGGKGRGFSLSDIIRVTHPKPVSPKQSALFSYSRGVAVCDGFQETLPKIWAYENLKQVKSEEEAISWIRAGRLPYNVVTGAVSMTAGIWNALFQDMPLFALLRHLSVFERHNLIEPRQEWLQQRLSDDTAIRRAKILPQRYVDAYRQVKTPWLKDVLRLGVEKSIHVIPEIQGKTAIFLDISGSMDGQFLTTASTFAFSLYKKTAGDCIFLLFDTELYDPNPSIHDSILSQAERIRARGGTDTGIGIKHLLEEKRKVDNIIIITDEQQNSGSAFYQRLCQYRTEINPAVKAMVVNVGPYDSAMAPEGDAQTFYVYGWSDAVLSYVSNATRGYHTIHQEVDQICLPGIQDIDGSGP